MCTKILNRRGDIRETDKDETETKKGGTNDKEGEQADTSIQQSIYARVSLDVI